MEAITREEMFLSDIAGDTKYNLEPITRTEKLLKKIAENGTGGGGFDPVVTYGDTLTWDGNTEELVSVDVGGMFFYRIADNVITLADCPNGLKGTLLTGSETSNMEASYETLESSIGFSGMINIEAIFFVPSDNFTANDLGITFPKAGVYCLSDPAIGYVNSITIPGYAGFETTSYPKIPVESLPEGYPYAEEGVILAEQELTASETGELNIEGTLPLVVGNACKVNWNGTEYSCVVKGFNATEMGLGVVPYIGNGADFGLPDTGEPFLVASVSAQNATVIISYEGLTSVTVSITGEIVHKMDAKYLPATGGGSCIVDLTSVADKFETPDESGAVYITEISYDTFAQAWYENRNIIFEANYPDAIPAIFQKVSPSVSQYISGNGTAQFMMGMPMGKVQYIVFTQGTWTPPV